MTVFPCLSIDMLQVRQTGFYTTQMRPGLRLFAMNSQLGYAFNFYTFLPEHHVADLQVKPEMFHH